jgi:hypothetical protein
MWNLGAIEPLFERLRKSLFGEYDVSIGRYYGGALKYNTAGGIDMEGSEGDVLRVLGEFFGKFMGHAGKEAAEEAAGSTAKHFAKETVEEGAGKGLRSRAARIVRNAVDGAKTRAVKAGKVALAGGAVMVTGSAAGRILQGENPVSALVHGVQDTGNIVQNGVSTVGNVANAASDITSGAAGFMSNASGFLSGITDFAKNNPWVVPAIAIGGISLLGSSGIGKIALLAVAGMAFGAMSGSGGLGDIGKGISNIVGAFTGSGGASDGVEGASADMTADVASGVDGAVSEVSESAMKSAEATQAVAATSGPAVDMQLATA